jgi:hypothetical protein
VPGAESTAAYVEDRFPGPGVLAPRAHPSGPTDATDATDATEENP